MMFWITRLVLGQIRLGKRLIDGWLRRFFPKRQCDLRGPNINRGGGPRALISYLVGPFLHGEISPDRSTHSNAWECREIAELLIRRGFTLDVANWDDVGAGKNVSYDLIFDVHQRLGALPENGAKLNLHATGSYPRFSSSAEEMRLNNIAARRGIRLKPRRSNQRPSLDAFDRSMDRAHQVTLIGNQTTLNTYPEIVRDKIQLVLATGSTFSRPRNLDTVRREPSFLWYNGVGAVHKGLDLLLELFGRRHDWTLHIVGPVDQEIDFALAYRRELFQTPNIVFHGFRFPYSREFHEIASGTMAFVNPTCSEGISTASITCMQYGLYPIVSLNAGISLPNGVGTVLTECSLSEIEEALEMILAQSESTLREKSREIQTWSQEVYSRREFSRRMDLSFDRLLQK
jgi:hypothetical protein